MGFSPGMTETFCSTLGGGRYLHKVCPLVLLQNHLQMLLSVDIPCIKNLNAVYLHEYFTYSVTSSVSRKEGLL